jgi:hypothetical protein
LHRSERVLPCGVAVAYGMGMERKVNLYLVHVYLDGVFQWENDNELHRLIYKHGHIQTIPLGTYEPDAKNIHKKIKAINVNLEFIEKALKNPGTIVICTVDKYEDYESLYGEYTLCTGLLASKV